MKQRGMVTIIISNARGKFLMHMRDNNPGILFPLTWSFFGGGMEDNESPEGAAQRELLEETGVPVEEQNLKVLDTVEFADRKGVQIHIVRCTQPIEWEMIRLGEGAGAGYFTADEIQQIGLNAWAKEIASRYLSRANSF